MCLFINNSSQKVAGEDIICYKILQECRLEGHPYMSPFIEQPIISEIIFGLYPYVGLGDRTIKEDSFGHLIITEGYIHTYKYKIVAEEMCNYYANLFNNDCHLFECKIPAGSKYYEGLDDNFLATYASDKIIFVSEI